MKSMVVSAILFLGMVANADIETLKCVTKEDGSLLLKNLTIQMEKIDTKSSAPVMLSGGVVKLTSKYEDGSQMISEVTVKQHESNGSVSGSMEIGEDFGSADITLMHDYDKDEVVAIVQIATDGPITVNVYRCK